MTQENVTTTPSASGELTEAEELWLSDEDEEALDRAWESQEVQLAVLKEELDEIERVEGKVARRAAEKRAKAYFAERKKLAEAGK